MSFRYFSGTHKLNVVANAETLNRHMSPSLKKEKTLEEKKILEKMKEYVAYL